MSKDDYSKFQNLNFDGFKMLALDDSLSQYEKIGFPNEYRAGKEEFIFRDITLKLSNLSKTNQIVLDIGPGCSEVTLMLIDLCEKQNHTLLLVDSQEMLDQLPEKSFITKIPAYYPRDCAWLFEKFAGKIHAVLVYSVLHYVFSEGNIFDFLDKSLYLLANGGEMLIGDIPNISKRKRFFSSPGKSSGRYFY